MTASRRALPLFPLNTVLFPNASLPLQIFEERYKRMLRDCMSADSLFGVALIREGVEVGGPAVPHAVGTVARIERVERIDEERFFVSAVGVQRYRTLALTRRSPYLLGEVETLDDGEPTPAEIELAREASDAFSEYARASAGVSGGWMRRTRLPSDPAALSYHIANAMELDASDKQRLLERDDAASRLSAEMDILRRAYSDVRRQLALQAMRRFSRQ